jgi:hypothetical protein
LATGESDADIPQFDSIKNSWCVPMGDAGLAIIIFAPFPPA